MSFCLVIFIIHSKGGDINQKTLNYTMPLSADYSMLLRSIFLLLTNAKSSVLYEVCFYIPIQDIITMLKLNLYNKTTEKYFRML